MNPVLEALDALRPAVPWFIATTLIVVVSPLAFLLAKRVDNHGARTTDTAQPTDTRRGD